MEDHGTICPFKLLIWRKKSEVKTTKNMNKTYEIVWDAITVETCTLLLLILTITTIIQSKKKEKEKRACVDARLCV